MIELGDSNSAEALSELITQAAQMTNIAAKLMDRVTRYPPKPELAPYAAKLFRKASKSYFTLAEKIDDLDTRGRILANAWVSLQNSCSCMIILAENQKDLKRSLNFAKKRLKAIENALKKMSWEDNAEDTKLRQLWESYRCVSESKIFAIEAKMAVKNDDFEKAADLLLKAASKENESLRYLEKPDRFAKEKKRMMPRGKVERKTNEGMIVQGYAMFSSQVKSLGYILYERGLANEHALEAMYFQCLAKIAEKNNDVASQEDFMKKAIASAEKSSEVNIDWVDYVEEANRVREQYGRIFGCQLKEENGYYVTKCTKLIRKVVGATHYSVGIKIRAYKCSICGRNYYECDHIQGEVYDGKPAYLVVEDLEFDHIALTDCPEDLRCRLTKVSIPKSWFPKKEEKQMRCHLCTESA